MNWCQFLSFHRALHPISGKTSAQSRAVWQSRATVNCARSNPTSVVRGQLLANGCRWSATRRTPAKRFRQESKRRESLHRAKAGARIQYVLHAVSQVQQHVGISGQSQGLPVRKAIQRRAGANGGARQRSICSSPGDALPRRACREFCSRPFRIPVWQSWSSWPQFTTPMSQKIAHDASAQVQASFERRESLIE